MELFICFTIQERKHNEYLSDLANGEEAVKSVFDSCGFARRSTGIYF